MYAAVMKRERPDGPPSSATQWPFPFPQPGRTRHPAPGAVPPASAYRWPFRPLEPSAIPSRGMPAPVGLAEFKLRAAEWCDDVGIISIDDPAIAHEREEVLWVYPHARSLVCMIGEQNKAAMQSRYLPSANNELYRCEERLWEMGRRTVKYINALGGEGLTTTIGWPQEVGQRWADKIWPLSHKLVAGGGARHHRGEPQLPPPEVRRLLPDRYGRHQPRVVHSRRAHRLESLPRVQ